MRGLCSKTNQYSNIITIRKKYQRPYLRNWSFCRALTVYYLRFISVFLKNYLRKCFLPPSLFFLGSFPCNVTSSSETVIKCVLHSTGNVFRITNNGEDSGIRWPLYVVNNGGMLPWNSIFTYNTSEYSEHKYCYFFV